MPLTELPVIAEGSKGQALLTESRFLDGVEVGLEKNGVPCQVPLFAPLWKRSCSCDRLLGRVRHIAQPGVGHGRYCSSVRRWGGVVG